MIKGSEIRNDKGRLVGYIGLLNGKKTFSHN